MAQKFAIDAIFRAIDQVSAPVAKMSRKVNKFATRMEKSLEGVDKVLGGIRSGAGKVGVGIAAGAGVAAAGIAKVVETGAEFEQTLVNAGSKFGSGVIKRGTKDFEALEKAALATSSTTEFSANEAAKAIEFMAMAGEGAKTSMEALTPFTDLATVAQIDLATAADIASDAIGPLGLATDDVDKKMAAYTKTVDLLAKTSNITNVAIPELFESVKGGAVSFTKAGQEVEQYLASIAVLAGQGKKGQKPALDLARAMSRMTDTATKAPKALRRIGVAVSKNGKIRDFLDIMDDLKSKMDKMSEVKGARIAGQIFGANSRESALILLDNLDKARDMQDRIEKAGGFAADAAKIQRDTTLADIKTFWSTVEATVIDVFKIIQPEIEKTIEFMTEWARTNKEAFGKSILKAMTFFRDNVDTIADKGPKVAKFIGVLWGLVTVLGVIKTVMGGVALVTTVTMGTFGLIALGVVAAIAALAGFIIFWDDIVDAFVDGIGLMVEFGQFLGTMFDKLTDEVAVMIGASIETLGEWVDKTFVLFEPMFDFFDNLWTNISDGFMNAMDVVFDGIQNAKKTLNEATGIDIFDVDEGPRTEALEDTRFVFRPNPNLERDLAIFGGGPAANAAPAPQVIDSTSETISRAVSESIQKSKLEVEIKDPGDNVAGVSEEGETNNLQVTRTGTL